jgi:hypothetical protein
LETNNKYKQAINSLIDLASKTSEKEVHQMNLLAKYWEIKCIFSRPGLVYMMMKIVCNLNTSKIFQVDDLFEN